MPHISRRTFNRRALAAGLGAALAPRFSQDRRANPIVPGHYADPESRVFPTGPGGDGRPTYWIYPTYSAPYNDQFL